MTEVPAEPAGCRCRAPRAGFVLLLVTEILLYAGVTALLIVFPVGAPRASEDDDKDATEAADQTPSSYQYSGAGVGGDYHGDSLQKILRTGRYSPALQRNEPRGSIEAIIAFGCLFLFRTFLTNGFLIHFARQPLFLDSDRLRKVLYMRIGCTVVTMCCLVVGLFYAEFEWKYLLLTIGQLIVAISLEVIIKRWAESLVSRANEGTSPPVELVVGQQAKLA